MIASEWLEVCAEVQDLWPSQPWSKSTATTAFPLFEALPAIAARKAVHQLASEGGTFAPPPPAVLALAKAIAKDLQPALPAADVTRDLTPEELERAQRRGAQLRAQIAQLANSKAMAS